MLHPLYLTRFRQFACQVSAPPGRVLASAPALHPRCIQHRFHGEWVGASDQPGWGLLRWTPDGVDSAAAPLLKVRDKGRIPAGQAVTWVIPSDGIAVFDRAPEQVGEFGAEVVDARRLGEITLATLALGEVGNIQLLLTLSGAHRLRFAVGTLLAVRLDLGLVHVMPMRTHGTPGER